MQVLSEFDQPLPAGQPTLPSAVRNSFGKQSPVEPNFISGLAVSDIVNRISCFLKVGPG